MDAFDRPGFAGNLRRLYGPADFARLAAGGARIASLIVGPGALIVGPPRRGAQVRLGPAQLIPDLSALKRAGPLGSLRLICVSSPERNRTDDEDGSPAHPVEQR